MAFIVADNIISPLGFTTAENISAVLDGHSALSPHPAKESGVGEDYTASVLSERQRTELLGMFTACNLSPFECKVTASAKKALSQLPGTLINTNRTVFILSTTKGNVENLRTEDDNDKGSALLARAAEKIAASLGIDTKPVVVCNACISGLSALILGQRLLMQGKYDYAVVSGTDDIGHFVLSGFQSLRALSNQPCRPFDMERTGLNLGEAAATIVLSREPVQEHDAWELTDGVVRNDACDIVAPSKKAEGQTRCLQQLLKQYGTQDIAFVNLHGTATLFNDQMESIALQRAGLSSIPANALKGYYGHTLGAAGLLETIVSLHCAGRGLLPATRGFSELGVSGKMDIAPDTRHVEGHSFIKTLSGFGGCNAAALFTHNIDVEFPASRHFCTSFKSIHHIRLTPQSLSVDGTPITTDRKGDKMLTTLYKRFVGDYPKYYKMDGLSRLGFIASELLLQAEAEKGKTERFCPRDDRAVVLFGRHSSLQADRKFLNTISYPEDYFPSPSVFVYTLPNIVTGEIAIRNKLHGETCYYALASHDETQMHEVLEATATDTALQSVISGWIDYVDGYDFLADLHLYGIERRK